MIAIAHYLFAAAWSGFYKKTNWQSWADNQILKLSSVDNWIYDVSLANNLDGISRALSDKIIDENYKNSNLELISDAVIGYYYMSYLENKITVYELLDKSGKEADGGESTIECEEFYSMLNDLEKNEYIRKDENFIKKIQILFAPFLQIALNQKERIEKF